MRRRAELARKLENGAAEWGRDTHEDSQRLRLRDLREELVELEIAVDDEIGDLVLFECSFRHTGQPDRRHEMADRIGKAASHDLDFGQGRGIKMTDSGGVDLVEHERRGVRLDRVEWIPRKGVKEALSRDREFLRKNDVDRIERLHLLDHLFDGSKARHARSDR